MDYRIEDAVCGHLLEVASSRFQNKRGRRSRTSPTVPQNALAGGCPLRWEILHRPEALLGLISNQNVSSDVAILQLTTHRLRLVVKLTGRCRKDHVQPASAIAVTCASRGQACRIDGR